jgi:hypothetical protein
MYGASVRDLEATHSMYSASTMYTLSDKKRAMLSSGVVTTFNQAMTDTGSSSTPYLSGYDAGHKERWV